MRPISELRAIAEAATPGPWRSVTASDPPISAHTLIGLASDVDGSGHVFVVAIEHCRSSDRIAANASHIATFDPPTVLALLARLERYEAALRESDAVSERVGCGDNSCLFKRPTGMATNGGCRCVGRGGSRPGATGALASMYRAARAALEEK